MPVNYWSGIAVGNPPVNSRAPDIHGVQICQSDLTGDRAHQADSEHIETTSASCLVMEFFTRLLSTGGSKVCRPNKHQKQQSHRKPDGNPDDQIPKPRRFFVQAVDNSFLSEQVLVFQE